MRFMHPLKSYKLDKGIMLIFVSEKNRPLLLAKGVHLHSQLNIWLQWIGQKQLQDGTRII